MIDGFINIYKEQGYTSFDVVAKLRGILKQKKINCIVTWMIFIPGMMLHSCCKVLRIQKTKIYWTNWQQRFGKNPGTCNLVMIWSGKNIRERHANY